MKGIKMKPLTSYKVVILPPEQINTLILKDNRLYQLIYIDKSVKGQLLEVEERT